MIQNIIVYLIVIGVIIYTAYAVVRSLKTKDKSPCDGCGGCDIKKEILKNVKPDNKAKMNCYH
jgi:hypothetical protein